VSNALLLSLLLFAGLQPWEKPQAEWTKSDIRKILYDSPWSASFHADDLGRSGLTYILGEGETNPRLLAITSFQVLWISSELVLRALPQKAIDQTCAQVSEKNRENFYLLKVAAIYRSDQSSLRPTLSYPVDKEKIYLRLKGRSPIPCESVLNVGKSGGAIILVFRRHGPDGSDLIQPENKKVTLHLTVGGPDIAVPFDLNEMKYEGRLDL